MDSDGEESPKQSIRRKNKPVAPILLSDESMGEGPHHSWELSDSGNLKDRNMAINDHGVSIVTSDASATDVFDGMASDCDGVLSAHSCESRTQTFPAKASDFIVLETIGTGSSSYVRKVLRKRDNRIMALKCINVCDPSLRDSIMSEIRMQIANLKSKHVVQFHGAFYSEGVIAIVLDLASAGSLGDIVRLRSRLPMPALTPAIPEPILAFMMEQVLLGLCFIHKQQHQVHRDFKPSNLLLDHSGRVLLSDFGTATSLDSTAAFCGQCIAVT
jgi:serine/threonine protein kinase